MLKMVSFPFNDDNKTGAELLVRTLKLSTTLSTPSRHRISFRIYSRTTLFCCCSYCGVIFRPLLQHKWAFSRNLPLNSKSTGRTRIRIRVRIVEQEQWRRTLILILEHERRRRRTRTGIRTRNRILIVEQMPIVGTIVRTSPATSAYMKT